MLRPTSLRARLVLGVIVLAAVGLAAADVATYTSLRSFLFHRMDSTLQAAHPIVEGNVFGRRRGGTSEESGPIGAGAPGVDYVEVRTLAGRIVESGPTFEFGEESAPAPPKLPAQVTLPSTTTAEGDRVTYLTVPAKSGGGRYRVRASIEPQAANRILLIASSLNGVESTLHRLVLIALL